VKNNILPVLGHLLNIFKNRKEYAVHDKNKTIMEKCYAGLIQKYWLHSTMQETITQT